VLQEHADINKLYRDSSVLNYFFQDWVRIWFSSGTRSDEFEFCNPKAPYKEVFKIHVANCSPDVVRGPIKAPNRVISKVVFVSTFPNHRFDVYHVLCVQSDVACQVYRSYRGRVDTVTDVIRCAIVFSKVDELVRFMEVCICLHVLLQPRSCAVFFSRISECCIGCIGVILLHNHCSSRKSTNATSKSLTSPI
jgi:hypothetical protein